MHKYGKLPMKLAITNPWEAVCVDLIGQYTLKDKDRTHTNCMCVTVIDPASSWFEIMELPESQLSEHDILMGTQGRKGLLTHKQKNEPYFDKTSATVGILINWTWFCCYPYGQYIVYDNRSELKLYFETNATHMG